MAEKEPASAQPLSAKTTTAMSWARARRRLAEADTYWLATVHPDGRPHVMPVLAVWLDGAVCFSTSESSRKGRNLACNSRCVLTVGSLRPPAVDLVVQGDAVKVTDEALLHRVADAYASKYGWRVTVRGGAFYGDGAPTAGPPPYAVFEVAPTLAFGFPGAIGPDDKRQGEEESFNPTRWRFS